MDVDERVIFHRLGKVNGIQHLDTIARLLKHFAGFQNQSAFGLHFVKIKNQDAAANLKITSFRFFLNDFSHLSIQCVL